MAWMGRMPDRGSSSAPYTRNQRFPTWTASSSRHRHSPTLRPVSLLRCICLRLDRWSLETLREYLQQRLAEAGIHASPLEPAAETLLLQSAQGIPRTLNHLLLRSLEQAAAGQRRQVSVADVQAALDAVPWLARVRPSK